MDINVWSLIIGIASLVVGIVSIVLAIVAMRTSKKESEKSIFAPSLPFCTSLLHFLRNA